VQRLRPMIECMSKFAAEGRRTQGGANSAQARKVDPVPLALTHRQIVELKTITATIPRRLRTVFTRSCCKATPIRATVTFGGRRIRSLRPSSRRLARPCTVSTSRR